MLVWNHYGYAKDEFNLVNWWCIYLAFQTKKAWPRHFKRCKQCRFMREGASIPSARACIEIRTKPIKDFPNTHSRRALQLLKRELQDQGCANFKAKVEITEMLASMGCDQNRGATLHTEQHIWHTRPSKSSTPTRKYIPIENINRKVSHKGSTIHCARKAMHNLLTENTR